MNIPTYMQEMRASIEEALREFVDRSIAPEYPELRNMVTYHMGWEGEGAGAEAQGKRIRPLLVLLCAEAAGGNWRAALPAAVAVELLHNFSLVHDDIQDNSPLRRSRPTVWVKWGAPQAINAGDILFTLSFLAIHDLAHHLPAQDVLQASRTLQETCLRLTEGQYLDMSFEKQLVLPEDAYWPMIGGKTSALLASCCELGALTAGVESSRRAAFRDYGYNLGLAFQVLDDWLGIWGEPDQTGKSTESDLVSGKKTLPVVYGLRKDGAFARRWMQGGIRPEEAPALAHMLDLEGAQAYTLEAARRLTEQATRALECAVAPRAEAGAADALQELTHALLQRKN
jgi:geranylgeranyl diphosphate synthase type I